MPCCRSMLARRIVLWYILLGSIAIFPLTVNVGLGCRFLQFSYRNEDDAYAEQSLGAFGVAIYDEENQDEFLGCVKYPFLWSEATDDVGFMVTRIASALLLACTTIATIICTCLQCFSKSGKSMLWNVMRFFYVVALFSQGAMYTIFFTDFCDEVCSVGHNAIAGAVNFFLLLGMVVSAFLSLPPRNPVFQCWGASEGYDSDDDSSTEEEDEVMRKFKSYGDANSSSLRSTSEIDDNESVSLFGGSRASKSTRKSAKVDERKLSKAKSEESKKSSATESSNSAGSKSQRSTLTATKIVEEEVSIAEDGSVVSRKSIRSTSASTGAAPVVLGDNASVASGTSEKSASKFLPLVAKYMSSKESKSGDAGSVTSIRSKKSGDAGSVTSIRSKKSGDAGSVASNRSVSLTSIRSKKSGDAGSVTSIRSKKSKEMKLEDTVPEYEPVLAKTSSILSTKSDERASFVNQLFEMTELTDGGRRITTDSQEYRIEIVDEYPQDSSKKIESSPSSDVVKIRTEYYDMGSRTIKEITHRDGSRTVVTTIVADDLNERQPMDPPIESVRSAGSIISTSSSKYRVVDPAPSDDTPTISGSQNGRQNALEQGQLCLSMNSPKPNEP